MIRKNLLFMLLALFFTSLQAANWEHVASTDNGSMYVDMSSIVSSGESHTAWVLMDYETIQTEAGDAYLSSRGQWQVNCRSGTLRQVYHSIFSGHMGGGQTIWSGNLRNDLRPAAPGSVGGKLLEFICAN